MKPWTMTAKTVDIKAIPPRTSLLGFACGVLLTVSGCKFVDLPNPNDPANIPRDQLAKRLREQIQSTADDLNTRVIQGQITDDKRKDLLSERARQLLGEGDPAHSSPQDAWIYADLYITENDYQDAIPLLKKAVAYAQEVRNDDRRVNDSFRLAVALAHEGQVGPALDLAQGVIDSKPLDPGPVLPSVLLQLTPVVEGKGHDEQLAHLLEESIQEHLRMKVDPNTDAGKAFLAAKPYHIRHAWDKMIELLSTSGHADQAAQAQTKEDAMLRSLHINP